MGMPRFSIDATGPLGAELSLSRGLGRDASRDRETARRSARERPPRLCEIPSQCLPFLCCDRVSRSETAASPRDMRYSQNTDARESECPQPRVTGHGAARHTGLPVSLPVGLPAPGLGGPSLLRSTCTHAAIAEASAARKAAVLPCERMANSHLPW